MATEAELNEDQIDLLIEMVDDGEVPDFGPQGLGPETPEAQEALGDIEWLKEQGLACADRDGWLHLTPAGRTRAEQEKAKRAASA